MNYRNTHAYVAQVRAIESDSRKPGAIVSLVPPDANFGAPGTVSVELDDNDHGFNRGDVVLIQITSIESKG